jgi:two-component system CheB/CheR fusion protein
MARAGLFPASISADVSSERLARFFTLDADGTVYRINKTIRDMLVFSEQDVTKDPPFSRLDFISCRNLLIYLTPELQKKILPVFHYALNPHGVLFLGTSESVGESATLFRAIDQKAKLYRRKDNGFAALGTTALPPALPGASAPARFVHVRETAPAKTPVRELAESELLAHAALVGALVDERGDVLYLHGRTGLYLEPSTGEPGVSNLLKMAREGLRPALASALRRAAKSSAAVHLPRVRIAGDGQSLEADLTVRPVGADPKNGPSLFLVVLEQPSPVVEKTARPRRGTATGLAALRRELQTKEEYLRSANEQLQSATEELQSSNEEMQSVNEELQSTNEELETSKEELQSVNEELSTVNAELQTKVLSLSQANNDMNNLLAGTGIGTVFVDHQLRIMRFTPAASAIINLILTDIGRPVAHLVSNLSGYDRLVADTREVLDTLVPKEIEVGTHEGKFYTMRIQPYRTLENVIEGAVISFIDITAMVQTREELRKANDLLRLAVVIRDAHDAITVQDLDGRTRAWNPAAARMYGWTEAEALQMNFRDRLPAGLHEEELARLQLLARGEVLPAYPSSRLTKDHRVLAVEVTATALVDNSGKIYAIATTEHPRKEPA